jgi:hypothetical protein
MRRLLSSCTVLALVLALLCTARTANSQPIDLEVADTYEATDECTSLEAFAGKLKSDVLMTCDAYLSGKISADKWVGQMNDLKAQIAQRATQDPLIGALDLTPKAGLPKAKAYALFLITSSEWYEKQSESQQLHKAFLDFGDSLSINQMAIWFSAPKPSLKPDIKRAKFYADNLKLDYNNGPYVVVTFEPPYLVRPGNRVVVMSLNNMTEDDRIRALNVLQQALRTDPGALPSQTKITATQYQQQIATYISQHGADLLKVGLAILDLKLPIGPKKEE